MGLCDQKKLVKLVTVPAAAARIAAALVPYLPTSQDIDSATPSPGVPAACIISQQTLSRLLGPCFLLAPLLKHFKVQTIIFLAKLNSASRLIPWFSRRTAASRRICI
ncbi:hypothetical protein N656DRAFT_779583 [Canariomyces notabilis]|uniref:Uncharacterized protein n=1 Tax=Canariomyces notabilis TaxID=2074819 RepID=A0AAN6TCW7_9PEZI|nr:hypothetical protein N656DRAFT_779583 [Canariomyces arenarius]